MNWRMYIYLAVLIAGITLGWWVTWLVMSKASTEHELAEEKAHAETLTTTLGIERAQRDSRHADAVEFAAEMQRIAAELAGRHDTLVCHSPAAGPAVPAAGAAGSGSADHAALPGPDTVIDRTALDAVGSECDAQVTVLEKPWTQASSAP